MPFLQASRAPILAFLLVSFLLLLVLSPTQVTHRSSYSSQLPLHYLTLRSHRHLPPSFYSARIHRAIYILKNDNRVVCRVYRACRLQNHSILLPLWIKPYSQFLLTQCGLTDPLVFSPHHSLNQPNHTINHDWIAPNTPQQHLHQYIQTYLPSFFSPLYVHPPSLANSENNLVNTTCLLPSTNRTHPLLIPCPTPPEPTIPYPAVILDQQYLKHQLTTTYQALFKHHLKAFDSESLYSTSDTICFRSIISSPSETNLHEDSETNFSTTSNADRSSKQQVPSWLENPFGTFSNILMNAFFDQNPTIRKKTGAREHANLGTINDFNALDSKEARNNRSLRKLLAEKSAGGNSQKSGNADEKSHTVTGRPSTSSVAKMDQLSEKDTKSNDSNQAFAPDNSNENAHQIVEERLPQDSKMNLPQGEAFNTFMREPSDDDDLQNSGDDYLPTFQYLLEYHPDS